MSTTAIPMGIGQLGLNNQVFKRKFRWTLQFTNICGGGTTPIPPYYVKVASRPSIDIEEEEINYLNAVDWIPGKGRWDTMEVTYLDVASTAIAPLYSWLASVYNFTSPITLKQGSARSDYTGTGLLTLYDGCGQPLEKWTMQNMWPKAINWGDLAYEDSGICDITITFRYSAVSYLPICPSFPITNCCTPCNF